MLIKQEPPELLFCPIRRQNVIGLPEEIVRQKLIHRMTQELGYPLGGFAVEKALHQLPHLANTSLKLPKRRADIIFFSSGIHPQYEFYPLLLIECKAVNLNDKVLRQIIGYNFYVKAPFIAAINQEKTLFGYYDKGLKNHSFSEQIPHYKQLIDIAYLCNKPKK